MITIIRALNHLRKLRLWAAIRIAVRIHDARAYRLALDWLLRRYYPRWFSSVARTVIWKDESDMGSISVGSARLADRRFAIRE
jgi:hypothetical protein